MWRASAAFISSMIRLALSSNATLDHSLMIFLHHLSGFSGPLAFS
jgi:hypothetical protein